MRILVAGVGNIFMKDDGCGSIMASVLEGKIKGADVRDYGTGGISLTDELQSYDVIMILDVAAIDEKVKVFEVDDLNEDKVVETVLSMSLGGSHGLGVEDIITILRSEGVKVKIFLVTFKPKEINTGVGVTEECMENAVLALEELKKLLENYGATFDLDSARIEFREALRKLCT